MSVNNGKAVLEAIFGNDSEFVRTPKYGIEKKDKKITKSKYRALKSIAPLFEFSFFSYFTYLVINAWQNANWFTLPFLMLFQVGFFLVAFGSIRSLISDLFIKRNDAKDSALPS